jgi:hypothetical protein
MTLGELAFGCYVFSREYDEAYAQLLQHTKPGLALGDEKHRLALLKWLNKWGCRQFAKEHHSLASKEIKEWYEEFGNDLCAVNATLLSLTDEQLDRIERAYAGLKNRTASHRRGKNGKTAKVSVGPAGTAKILFALRPDALMPWDDPIRDKFGWDGSARSYRKHLEMARCWLNELSKRCKEKGFQLAELPSKVGRPGSSLAKLMDEYLWVTITSGCAPPDKGTLQRWVDWS